MVAAASASRMVRAAATAITATAAAARNPSWNAARLATVRPATARVGPAVASTVVSRATPMAPPRRLGCDNSYVTPLVDALEKRGLAVRQPHPTDRRIKVIVLTGQGLELAKRVQLADTTPPAAFSAPVAGPGPALRWM